MHQPAPYSPPHRATRSPSRGPRDAVSGARPRFQPPGREQTSGGEGQTKDRLRGRALKRHPGVVQCAQARPSHTARGGPLCAHPCYSARREELCVRLRGQRQALVPYRQSGRTALGPGRGRHARSSCLPKHGDVVTRIDDRVASITSSAPTCRKYEGEASSETLRAA